MEQHQQSFDELTLALEAHLRDHGAMLRAIAALSTAGTQAEVEALLSQAAESWRFFIVKLTERATSMAAVAANGVITRYLDDVAQIKQRLAALEDMVEGGP